MQKMLTDPVANKQPISSLQKSGDLYSLDSITSLGSQQRNPLSTRMENLNNSYRPLIPPQ